MKFFEKIRDKVTDTVEDVAESIVKLVSRVGIKPTDGELDALAERSKRYAEKVAKAAAEEFGDLPGVPDVAANMLAAASLQAAQMIIAGALEGAKRAND